MKVSNKFYKIVKNDLCMSKWLLSKLFKVLYACSKSHNISNRNANPLSLCKIIFADAKKFQWKVNSFFYAKTLYQNYNEKQLNVHPQNTINQMEQKFATVT